MSPYDGPFKTQSRIETPTKVMQAIWQRSSLFAFYRTLPVLWTEPGKLINTFTAKIGNQITCLQPEIFKISFLGCNKAYIVQVLARKKFENLVFKYDFHSESLQYN